MEELIERERISRLNMREMEMQVCLDETAPGHERRFPAARCLVVLG